MQNNKTTGKKNSVFFVDGNSYENLNFYYSIEYEYDNWNDITGRVGAFSLSKIFPLENVEYVGMVIVNYSTFFWKIM